MCGLQFYNIWIDRTIDKPINMETVNAGRWFEWKLTGYGEPIEPVRIKSGELNATYRVLEKQLDNAKRFMETWKDDTTYFGVTLEVEEPIALKGVMDVLSENCIRDIKTTGNIDGRDEYAWGGDIKYKPMMTQAKCYVYLVWKHTGRILPFYFDVYSNKSELDVKCFEIEFTEDQLLAFEDELKEISARVDFYNATGYEAYPSLKNCSECPLKESCEFFNPIPVIEKVVWN